ncbi:MAG: RNA polymerase sigma factor RpoD/SigA [Ruminococcus sp.]|nr:RNA polymerase sigma factor RpoD/SigA [Ruminococcus sp.]
MESELFDNKEETYLVKDEITDIELDKVGYMTPTQILIEECSNYPPLTKEWERQLLKQAKRGNKLARDCIVKSNVRLILWTMNKYTPGVPTDDAIQEGFFGLQTAIDKFDIDRGTKFSTYAVNWIRQSITRSMLKQTPGQVTLPTHLIEKRSKINKFRNQYESENGQSPTIEQIAEATGYNVKMVRNVLQTNERMISMSAPIGTKGEKTVGDVIEDEEQDIVDRMAQDESNRLLIESLDSLPCRTATVLKMKYGIYPYTHRYSLSEIGEALDLTRERVRQLESSGISKLRNERGAELRSYYGKGDAIEAATFETEITKAIASLPDEEKLAVSMYMGLTGKRMTVSEIAKKLNVKNFDVYQYINNAAYSLRNENPSLAMSILSEDQISEAFEPIKESERKLKRSCLVDIRDFTLVNSSKEGKEQSAMDQTSFLLKAASLVKKYPTYECIAIVMYFGINATRTSRTPQEIANALKLTSKEIYDILNSAIDRLRNDDESIKAFIEKNELF